MRQLITTKSGKNEEKSAESLRICAKLAKKCTESSNFITILTKKNRVWAKMLRNKGGILTRNPSDIGVVTQTL